MVKTVWVQPLTDSSPELEEWQKRGRELATGNSKHLFQIGDWIAEGAAKWNRAAYAYAAAFFPNMKKEQQRNLVSVARSVPTSLRNDVLSWSHHAAVARFADEPEIQKELLAYAAAAKIADEDITVAEFRQYISTKYPNDCSQPKPNTSPSKINTSITITLLPEALAKVESFAEKHEESLESAICHLIDRALSLPDIAQEIDEPAEVAV